MNRNLFTVLVLLTLSISSVFAGYGLPTTLQTDVNGKISNEMFAGTMEDNLAESTKLLEMSQQLQLASESMDSASQLNSANLKAMLALSDDIGKMADSIGEMADRIVQTETSIGEMADRIVTVSQMIINNQAQTQENLLAAQKNLNQLLLGLGA